VVGRFISAIHIGRLLNHLYENTMSSITVTVHKLTQTRTKQHNDFCLVSRLSYLGGLCDDKQILTVFEKKALVQFFTICIRKHAIIHTQIPFILFLATV
jgi:hypothetical protein